MLNLTGSNIIRLDETDSTNSYASQHIKQQPFEEGLIIITDHQTLGKGQAGNKWESEKGKNLTFSVILTPVFLPVEDQFLISKIASLAVLSVLRYMQVDNISIKWPNDIYVADRKIAGILIENAVKGNVFETSIIGTGININQTKFSEEIANPTSLKMITNKDFDPEACLKLYIAELQQWYQELKLKNYSLIDKEYLNSIYHFNSWAYYIYMSEKILARIVGVNKYGKLLLEREDASVIECDIKEIKYLI